MKQIDIGDMLESEKDAALAAADELLDAIHDYGVRRTFSSGEAVGKAMAAYRKARACADRCEVSSCRLARDHEGPHAGGGEGACAPPLVIVTGSFVGAANVKGGEGGGS